MKILPNLALFYSAARTPNSLIPAIFKQHLSCVYFPTIYSDFPAVYSRSYVSHHAFLTATFSNHFQLFFRNFIYSPSYYAAALQRHSPLPSTPGFLHRSAPAGLDFTAANSLCLAAKPISTAFHSRFHQVIFIAN